MRVNREGIDAIKSHNDLCEIVLEHGIELKRRGRSYFGLCPFHEEKTASFAVSREAGLFHCFGCGVGGDVIGFVVRFDGVSFPEALRRLASRAGISLQALMEPATPGPSRDVVGKMATARFERFARTGRRP